VCTVPLLAIYLRHALLWVEGSLSLSSHSFGIYCMYISKDSSIILSKPFFFNLQILVSDLSIYQYIYIHTRYVYTLYL
jgi:hypothetical protein